MNDKTKKVVAEIEKDLADAATPLGESEIATGVMAGAVVGSLGGIPGAVAGAVIGGAAAVVGAAVASHEKAKHDEDEEPKEDDDIGDRPTPTTPGN